MQNKIKRLEIPKSQYIKFIEILSAHNDIYIVSDGEDKSRIKVKPSRKGRVFGKGMESYKEPSFEYRAVVTFTNSFKGDLDRKKKLNI